MKTILHIFRTYSNNESLKNDIVESCRGNFRNIVCYLNGEDDDYNRMYSVADEIFYLELGKGETTWRNSKSVRAVSDIIDSHEVDIVGCHMWRPIPIGVLAAKRSRRRPRTVGVFHGVKEYLSWGMQLVYYLTLRRLDRIVSVSEGGMEEIKSLFWSVDTSKLSAIPNGLDFTGFLTVEPGDRAALFGEKLASRRLFITVSRLAEKKNLERLLRAFSQCRASYPNAGLVIVGDGPLRESLEAVVAELQLGDSVVFLGYRQDIPVLLRSADVYAIPSLREGLPRSLVEAMAIGKPVLASRINGHLGVVKDREHGRLVDPEDIDDIASALAHFMNLDEAELDTVGAAARHHAVEHYDRSVMMASYLRLFLDVAGLEAAAPGPSNPAPLDQAPLDRESND